MEKMYSDDNRPDKIELAEMKQKLLMELDRLIAQQSANESEVKQ